MKLIDTRFISIVMLFVSIGLFGQENETKKDEKEKLTKRLWGGYDSNAIEKNLIIKDAFVTDQDKLLQNVKVALKINNTTVDSMYTDKDGGFSTALKFDYNYKLEFSKAGYVKKFVEIDLTNMPGEFKEEGYDLGRFQMGMVKYVQGMDVEEYKTPVARYYFDDRTKMVTLDRSYLKKKRKEVEKQKERNAKLIAEAKEDKNLIQEEYNVLIRDADIEFEAKDYQLAKSYYKEAIKLKPLAEYPRAQLKIIDGLLDGKLADKEKFDLLVAQADEAFELKEYEESKNLYLSAIKVNTTKAYPRDQIKTIDAILESQKVDKEEKKKTDYSLKDVEVSTDRAAFCAELAKKYPQGMTEERYMEGSKSIVKRVIVEGDIGVEYKYVTHNWGGTYFFKNGKPTTRFIWQKEALQN